ncbi:hypothetical protein [Dyadobacter sp. 676]|uniref:Beta-lactamase-related domain-containing protein n=1 Tax=Dyadobacter sp. 676 TaxID=3088362 RepID=A0AAU8FHK5_9BACT
MPAKFGFGIRKKYSGNSVAGRTGIPGKVLGQALLVLLPLGLPAQDRLATMEKAINAGDYPNVHSVLISRNGKVVYERYFNGYGPDSLHGMGLHLLRSDDRRRDYRAGRPHAGNAVCETVSFHAAGY